MTTDLLTAAQVAELFGVAVTTVSRWARTGKLPALRTPGDTYRFRRADVEAFFLVPEQKAQ